VILFGTAMDGVRVVEGSRGNQRGGGAIVQRLDVVLDVRLSAGCGYARKNGRDRPDDHRCRL